MRIQHATLFTPFILALLLAFGPGGLAEAADIVGPAEVIEGDVLEINGTRIRIFGIDAPELDQTCKLPSGRVAECGKLAITQVQDILGAGGDVRCVPVGEGEGDSEAEGQDGLILATCYDPGGTDMGWNMVYTGWAMAYAPHTADYSGVEEAARAAKRGMWRSEITPPWEWREK